MLVFSGTIRDSFALVPIGTTWIWIILSNGEETCICRESSRIRNPLFIFSPLENTVHSMQIPINSILLIVLKYFNIWHL